MQEELVRVHNKYPPDWAVNIQNLGKIVALYDKAQNLRNKNFKYEENKKEIMLIYNILHKKISSVYALNMRTILEGEEVLNFGFDDFNNSISSIMVQAKSLYMY